MDPNITHRQPELSPSRCRPLSVTLLAIGVLTLAGINLLRFVVSLQQRDFLTGLLSVHPLYISVTGLFWAVTGLALAWALWFGKKRAVFGTQAAALVYSLYYWLDRLLLVSGSAGFNWPFVLGMNIVLLLLVYWILTNRKAKAFFGAMYD